MAQKKSIIERNLRIEYIAIDALVPDPNNARKHSQEQVSRLAMAIAEIGFTNPVLIDQVNGIIAGHARREAARIAGLTMVPCIRLEGLDEATKKALAIADNKFGDMSGWDTQVLAKTLSGLEDLSFDIELTGFDTAELDILLSVESKEIDPDDLADEIDELAEAVTKFGDLWLLGPHRLFCGDALSGESYDRLLDGVKSRSRFYGPRHLTLRYKDMSLV